MTWTSPDARRAPSSSVLPFATALSAASRLREDVLTGLMTAAAVVLLGAPAGLLWSALAPHSQVVVTAGEGFIADAESEVFIAGDGWFVGITLLAGVLAGALAWLVARRSGPFVVVGLAVGGVVAAYVASRVGVQIGRDELLATVRSGRDGTYVGNVALQAKSAVAVWPLGAMAAFAALVASRVDELE